MGEKALDAFNKIKEEFIKNIELKFYNPRSGKLILRTDTSEFCIGCVLEQFNEIKKEFQQIIFYSQKLSLRESKFSISEKEAYAIVRSVEKLACYLLGVSFIVETDHKALIGLFSNDRSKTASNRIIRLRLRLSIFPFTLKFREGSENYYSANTISRLVQFESENLQENEKIIISNIKGSSEPNGPIYDFIFDCLQKNDFKNLQDRSYKNLYTMKYKFKLWNGDIYFGNRWFVPLHLRSEILKEAHKVNLGTTSTYNTLKELYFWPNLYTDIKTLIQNY